MTKCICAKSRSVLVSIQKCPCVKSISVFCGSSLAFETHVEKVLRLSCAVWMEDDLHEQIVPLTAGYELNVDRALKTANFALEAVSQQQCARIETLNSDLSVSVSELASECLMPSMDYHSEVHVRVDGLQDMANYLANQLEDC